MLKKYLVCGFLFCITITVLVLVILAFNEDSKETIGTSFEDIPEDFKNKINTYIDELLSTRYTEGEYQYLNGIKCPKNLKTDHNKFQIGSSNYKKNLIELFFLLHLFHLFAQKHNLLYCITAGSLLGYYEGGHIMLWDDDIDLLLSKTCAKFIKHLWKNSGKSFPLYGDSWSYKKIRLSSYNIILVKRKVKGWEDFYKIKLNTSNYGGDIGGIDLTHKPNWEDASEEKITKFLNGYKDTVDKYPLIEFGPVKTRALNKEFATILLDGQYGKNWKKRIHPSIKPDN